MLGRHRIWVIGTRDLKVKSTHRTGATEMAVLHEHFVPERSFPVHGVGVVLFVRKDA
jgi:mannosyltransferase